MKTATGRPILSSARLVVQPGDVPLVIQPSRAAQAWRGAETDTFVEVLVGYRRAISARRPVTEKLGNCLGAGFALIVQSGEAAAVKGAFEERSYLGLLLEQVLLSSNPQSSDDSAWQIVPPSKTQARPLLTHRDQIMLIRPARYCAAAFSPSELVQALARYTSTRPVSHG